jgi:predicted Rossmann fold flavoprotein
MIYDVLIIGAGPSGIFSAISCAERGLSVCLLEKNDAAGKKFLLSGSGRCNLTNAAPIDTFMSHYGSSGRFVKHALYNFTNKALIEYFGLKGIPCVEMNDGKIFPESQKAKDLLSLMLYECARLGVDIKYNITVESLDAVGGLLSVKTSDGILHSKNIIISTGGKSYPLTGSSGDGYLFAERFGHTVTEHAPCLTPVYVRDYKYSGCSGISFENIPVSVLRNGKKIISSSGDILFTHKGLSGPGILDISRDIRSEDSISLQLIEFKSADDLDRYIADLSLSSGIKTIKNILTSLKIPERLALELLNILNIPADTILARLDKKSRKRISENITALTFTVEKLGDYGEAMATRGGISLDEIDRKTMESKIVKGLFFTGEVLDVSGDTGGYNLQFAFSSAMLAAEHLLLSKASGTSAE